DESLAHMLAQPSKIALQSGTRHDEQEGSFGKAADGEIALNPAARVQHLRIDDAPDRNVDVVAAELLQERTGVAAFDADFAERGHVKEANAFAYGHMFVAIVVEPVLALPRIAVVAFLI